MTREENLSFRQKFPYDAMGDYSVFCQDKENAEKPPSDDSKTETTEIEIE